MNDQTQSTITELIPAIPKVELHVHLEGAIRTQTLLELARKNHKALPVNDIAGLRDWYQFRDFPDFISKYILLSDCIQTVEDLYFIGKEFLVGQAAQNIRYSEVTYTAYTHFKQKNIPIPDQIAALMHASDWAEQELGVKMRLIIDISRETSAEEGYLVAQEALQAMDKGVVALGLGGYELGNPPGRFHKAFALAHSAGLPCILHAGETAGADSIWEALEVGHSVRIGHGVRCLEDQELVAYLREKQIPLEVCPTSNVCLGVAPDIAHHPVHEMMQRGLYVTINSDDPALFSTTLNDEYQHVAKEFAFTEKDIYELVVNGIQASLMSEEEKKTLLGDVDRKRGEITGKQ
jgi:adenosine deaminase